MFETTRIAATTLAVGARQPWQASTPFGRDLAARARDHATRTPGDGRSCYAWVADALDQKGIHLHGRHAYMAADQLAERPEFREARGLRPDQLRMLPAGAVVVWDRGPGHASGHVSIALGDGREASDRIRPQITAYGTPFRVFLPR